MKFHTKNSMLVSFITSGIITAGIVYALVGVIYGYFASGLILKLALFWGGSGVVGGAIWGFWCGSRAIDWFLEGQSIYQLEPWRNVVAVGRRCGIILGVLVSIMLGILAAIFGIQVTIYVQIVVSILVGTLVGHFASGSGWRSHVSKAARHVGY